MSNASYNILSDILLIDICDSFSFMIVVDKNNRVYLYDVISINGVSYPIYTSKPYRNYNLINNRKGFPTDCTAIYASLIRNLRLSIVKSALAAKGRF